MLFKNIDRPDVVAKDADVPLLAVEVGQRNAGVVLDNDLAVIEDEIADPIEAIFEHEIGRCFEQTRADSEVIAKP